MIVSLNWSKLPQACDFAWNLSLSEGGQGGSHCAAYMLAVAHCRGKHEGLGKVESATWSAGERRSMVSSGRQRTYEHYP